LPQSGTAGLVGLYGRQLRPRDVFAGFRIESLVGQGRIGRVYKARDLRLGRIVAVKVILPELAQDDNFRARFEREVSLAAQIEHPNVIPIYQVGDEYGDLYFAMPFLDAVDLGVFLRSHGRLEPADAARVVKQLAAALGAAHARGLVHQDVKPGNVLVTGTHPNEHLYLTDFGLTKQVCDSVVRGFPWIAGSFDYVAPEQLRNEPVDARSDVYALGCLLYELLTGTVPFLRDREDGKISAHLSLPAPHATGVVPGLPAALDAVVARAMAKDPSDRFQSAGELARAATAAAGGRAGGGSRRPRRPRSR
jgi:serine/threonine-protein kinase